MSLSTSLKIFNVGIRIGKLERIERDLTCLIASSAACDVMDLAESKADIVERLKAARQEYNALIPPGEQMTWA